MKAPLRLLHRVPASLAALVLGLAVPTHAEDIPAPHENERPTAPGQTQLDAARAVYHEAGRLSDAGNYDAAEKKALAAIAMFEPALGKGHPETVLARIRLADVHEAQVRLSVSRKPPQMRPALQAVEVRPIFHYPCGNDFLPRPGTAPRPPPETPRLARAREADYEVNLAEGEMAVNEIKLGPEHPAVFQSSYDLALCLEKHDMKPEARFYALRAREGFEKTLGKDHPSTKKAQLLIVRLYATGHKK